MADSQSPVDPDGLLEYSVVFTDRSLNHMSQSFQSVMRDISSTLKSVYKAHSVVVVPGGGSYAMEAVARQFAGDRHCLVVRNGWFSYRWSQIFEMGKIPASTSVIMARRIGDGSEAPFAPPPVEEVVAAISSEKPDVVFAPHVETSSGIILPENYISTVARAAHDVGGLFVLDCIASGCVWVDMQALGIDVLISAPQKGWSSPPSSGLVMLSEVAHARLDETTSSSFACDLKKWSQVMGAYESGGHAYHATMPTDALKRFHEAMIETVTFGLDKACRAQWELGSRVRNLLKERGFESVASDGFGAPGVVVSYTSDGDIKTGKKFAGEGMQIAAGVPLECGEGPDFSSFRLGLFGLDKLQNIDRTVERLESVLNRIG